MSSEYFYNTETVKQAAQGKWLAILATLCPAVEPAIQKLGKHVACPMHNHRSGEKNRDFRLPRNADQTGAAFCSRETWSDGFELIKSYHGCDFGAAVTLVGDALGLDPIYKRSSGKSQNQRQSSSNPENKGLKTGGSGPGETAFDAQADRLAENSNAFAVTGEKAEKSEETVGTGNEAFSQQNVSLEQAAEGTEIAEVEQQKEEGTVPVVERGAAEKALQNKSYLSPKAHGGLDDHQIEQFRENNWKEAVDLRSENAGIACQYLAHRKIAKGRRLSVTFQRWCVLFAPRTGRWCQFIERTYGVAVVSS